MGVTEEDKDGHVGGDQRPDTMDLSRSRWACEDCTGINDGANSRCDNCGGTSKTWLPPPPPSKPPPDVMELPPTFKPPTTHTGKLSPGDQPWTALSGKEKAATINAVTRSLNAKSEWVSIRVVFPGVHAKGDQLQGYGAIAKKPIGAGQFIAHY